MKLETGNILHLPEGVMKIPDVFAGDYLDAEIRDGRIHLAMIESPVSDEDSSD